MPIMRSTIAFWFSTLLSVAYGSLESFIENESGVPLSLANYTIVGSGSSLRKSLNELNNWIQNITAEVFSDMKGSSGLAVDDMVGAINKTDAVSMSDNSGSISNVTIDDLQQLTLLDLETDIYLRITSFAVFFPKINICGRFQASETIQITFEEHNQRSFCASVTNVTVNGSTGMYITKLNRMIYRRFVVKQRQQIIEIQFDKFNYSSVANPGLQDEIVKKLVSLFLDNKINNYLDSVRQITNQKLQNIKLDDYLPDMVNDFDYVTRQQQSNNGAAILSEIYTNMMIRFLKKYPVVVQDLSKSFRKKGYMANFIYGNFSLRDGWITGMNSVKIVVADYDADIVASTFEGTISFPKLTLRYDYYIDYFDAGIEQGSVSISMVESTAKFTAFMGMNLGRGTTFDFKAQDLKFKGPSEQVSIRTPPSEDWKVTTFQDMIIYQYQKCVTETLLAGLKQMF